MFSPHLTDWFLRRGLRLWLSLATCFFTQVQSGRLKCQQLWGRGKLESHFSPAMEKMTSNLYYTSES